jgi:hypothetical protein
MGKIGNTYNILVGRHEGKNHSEDLSVDGRITLEWKFWTGCIWFRIWPSDELL